MYLTSLEFKRGEIDTLKHLQSYGPTKEKLNNFLPLFTPTGDTLKYNYIDLLAQNYSNNILISTEQLQAIDITSLNAYLTSKGYTQFSLAYPLTQLTNIIQLPNNLSAVLIDPTNWQASSTWLQNELNNLPDIFIIDFKHIDKAPLASNLSQLINLLSGRQIVILSGSVPKALPVNASTNYNHHLLEYDFFVDMTNNYPYENINYGDYATKFAGITPTGGISVAQLRYTHEDTNGFNIWFVRKGTPGNANLINLVATEISKSNFFTQISWADQKILQIIRTTPNQSGNSTTWVSMNLNHHIALFI
ncbi:beta family protein [Weissella confusa]|uniref:beta family protein n=1 Tax=Weissella confusa TaxID=1583 RepID=UPI001C6F6590|nr:beta family protein [Weissella confusa]QYU58846.1 beta family protein [Weissella confusa]